MKFFHRGGSSKRTIAVVDVGSGSAGVAILQTSPDTAVETLAAHRSILPFEDRSEEQMVAGVMAQVIDSGEKVNAEYSTGQGKDAQLVEEVYAVIRPPWTRSKTALAVEEYETETMVTEEMIARLAQKALADDTEFTKDTLLEISVIRVELNGYATSKPVGKKAHQLAVTVFASDCEQRVRSAITEAAGKLFPGRKPTLYSGARAFLTVMRERAHDKSGYLLVDMVSEATAFVVVRDGAIAEHALVREGVRTLLKRIAGENGSQEETLSLVRMIIADACHGEACDQLNAALSKVEPELARVFGEALAKLAAQRRLPTTLALSVHPDLAPWLAAFFSRIDFTQFTTTTQPFEVDVLSTEHLAEWVHTKSGVNLDTGLSIASAFVNIQTRS